MKKIILTAIILFNLNQVVAQKVITRNGEVKFEASVPAFEEIAATNNTVSCIFDKTTGDIAVLALVKGFKFKSPLMEEHFNENYMESVKFPKATFKGKVLNFDASKTSGTYDVEGDLTIHGVTKKIKSKVSFTNANKTMSCSFSVKPQDYGIEIPSVVKNKIAQNVKISLKFDLTSK